MVLYRAVIGSSLDPTPSHIYKWQPVFWGWFLHYDAILPSEHGGGALQTDILVTNERRGSESPTPGAPGPCHGLESLPQELEEGEHSSGYTVLVWCGGGEQTKEHRTLVCAETSDREWGHVGVSFVLLPLPIQE